jgi:prephenate dehydrogenase
LVRWKKITLVGVGLLGGSLGLALKKRRLAAEVVGFVRREASVLECRKKGVVDLATLDLARAVAGAELIVLCTPLSQMRDLVKCLLPSLTGPAVLTDVGSVKASVVRELEALVAKAGSEFIGSHPMAGAEKSGVSAARADLFVNAVCVTTPTPKSNRSAHRKVESLWKSVGCRLLRLTPAAHDELVSRSSHLPHVIASEVAGLVLDPAHPKQQPALCANGFRDVTRIASGSPEMWRDIALANRENLVRRLEEFMSDLKEFKGALKRKDERAIASFFESAKRRRDAWSAGAGSKSFE